MHLGMAHGCCVFLAVVAVFLACAQCCPAAAPAKQQSAVRQENVWTFGQSRDRRNPLWHEANDTDAIVKKTKPKALAKERGVMDTSGGINRALDQAVKTEMAKETERLNGGGRPRAKGSVGMSMVNESSSWKVAPGEMRADEYVPRDRKHVLRAFADVKAGEDLDIRVGPELHLRDESVGTENAHEKQPDSSLGVGMHFKLDF